MNAQGRSDRCHRCLQPLPANTRRCPNCREIVRRSDARRISIYLGVAGLIVVLAIVAVGLFFSPPASESHDETTVEQPATPRKPAKKPPLN